MADFIAYEGDRALKERCLARRRRRPWDCLTASGATRAVKSEVLDGYFAVRLASQARSLVYGAFEADIAAEKVFQRAMPVP